MFTLILIKLLAISLAISLSDAKHLNHTEQTNQIKSHFGAPLHTNVTEAVFGEHYEFKVNSTIEYTFQYVNASEWLRSRTARVSIESTSATKNFPVLIVVRQQKGILSWQLPLIIGAQDAEYKKVSRTLCPSRYYRYDSHNASKKKHIEESVIVSISSSSPVDVSVNLKVFLIPEFYVHPMENKTIAVSPSEPHFFAFSFPKHIDTMRLKVNSNDDICTTVSVQTKDCPIFDLERNVEFEGQWETMYSRGGMTIKKEWFENGFYLVFVVNGDDSDCIGHTENENSKRGRNKTLSFMLEPGISVKEYLTAALGGILIFVMFYIVTFGVMVYYMCRRTREPSEFRILNSTINEEVAPEGEQDGNYSNIFAVNQEGRPCLSRSDDTLLDITTEGEQGGNNSNVSAINEERRSYLSRSDVSLLGIASEAEQAMNNSDISPILEERSCLSRSDDDLLEDVAPEADQAEKNTDISAILRERRRSLSRSDSSLDEDDIDVLHDIERDKDIFRTKRTLHVCDLARKNHRALQMKSMQYLWSLVTVGVFYALPVVQLVVTNQTVLNQTGNLDLCYYNFRCSHPLGLLSDFNHVFSNVGYVTLGFLFILVTLSRERSYKNQHQCAHPYGIPQHFGLFYAMGSALMIEGVLSASYHVCPNHSNFQFDTSFMNVIAVLCMVKIYQNRHPDINARAYATFSALSGVTFLGMWGVIGPSLYFWLGFTVLHIVTCLIMSAQIYYMRRWTIEIKAFKRVLTLWFNEFRQRPLQSLAPKYPSRMVLLILGNLCNWVLASLGIVHHFSDFASHLISIFMANLILYCIFYIVMKICYKEKILLQPLVYIILSFIAWGAALFFFFQKSISWKLTPAQSRTYNQDCLVGEFYDKHDIWHFLSATSMFFSFMVLLTLDDDLVNTSRDVIPVF